MLPEFDHNDPADGGVLPAGANDDGQDDETPAASAPVAWRGRVIQILTEAGPDAWLSTGQIHDALTAAGIDLGRQAVSKALGRMVGQGHIRTRGVGSGTVYAAPVGNDM
jgi:hypothetical protein